MSLRIDGRGRDDCMAVLVALLQHAVAAGLDESRTSDSAAIPSDRWRPT